MEKYGRFPNEEDGLIASVCDKQVCDAISHPGRFDEFLGTKTIGIAGQMRMCVPLS
jgi:hypothetical protein